MITKELIYIKELIICRAKDKKIATSKNLQASNNSSLTITRKNHSELNNIWVNFNMILVKGLVIINLLIDKGVCH